MTSNRAEKGYLLSDCLGARFVREKAVDGTSLVVQGLRLHALMLGARVQFLVRELDPT